VRRGWRAAVPEVIIAAIGLAAVTLAAWAYAGPAVAGLVVASAGVAALLVLRGLAPADDDPTGYEESEVERATSTFTGFWRRRAEVSGAMRSMAGYDFELRGQLQRLFAARLAQEHGISLYADPEAARQILARRGGDRLWFWLDPARPPVEDQGRAAGIPPRTLAAILDRLERL
jgi:hypothetical protein